MNERIEYKVTALRRGTVIDHLPQGMALKALKILGSMGEGVVTIGLNLDSPTWGKKDIVKIESRELTESEFAKIALLGPHTSISIIRDYKVIDKHPVSIPDEIRGVVGCQNPNCITNHDPVRTHFHVESKEPLRMRCQYCERILTGESAELL